LKKAKYDSGLVSATANNLFLKMVIAGLLFILVVLSLYIKQSEVKEKTIIVPTGFNQGFTIDGDDISAEYVIQMSRYLLSLKESFNPKNAAKQFDEFLGYLSPSIYGEFKQKNVVDLRRIKKSQISQVFHLSGVEVYGNNAYLFGDMTGYIGTKVVKEREAIFKIGLGFNGVLRVIEFTEVREELSQSGELRFIGVIASE
jgi:conjugal transfer pilus assembly protein TraE